MTKKEQILEAALELFGESGYEGTSVRALAAKAGVNVAMISYYFGSKKKLFEELMEYRAGHFYEKILTLKKEVNDPAEQLMQVVEFYVDKILSQPVFHRILYRQISLQQHSDLNSGIISMLVRNLDEIRKIIEDGIARKQFRPVHIELTIASIFGTISQVVLSSLFTARMMNAENASGFHYSGSFRNELVAHLRQMLSSMLGINILPDQNIHV
ncbi:MAG: TetR/AcrR family transcriptional regulator [Bacteroidia bacterium]|nr:TetR/AcrR family transcriptional regulator [Bacteroidia bacterium]